MNIKSLTIYTSQLEKQTKFYTDVLNLEPKYSVNDSVSFTLGESVLNIVFSTTATPYHFAINIPSNKEDEAFNWLKKRVDVLKDGNHTIIDFVNWNAKAMYFYDADYNIVELIARKNLNNASTRSFDQNSFLEISEIGIPTTSIKREFTLLNENCGLEVYDGSFERFCAVGNDNGLFICINKNTKKWYPTNDKAYSSDFEMIIEENGKTYSIEYRKEELKALLLNE
ncbi:VOC family protein [Aquimarina mytili]|uniref:VOC family protein n=1 Tax=Aquimarina mytili TaxID=874423 RepID=A0A937D6V2_9FLAO|nr:VOC family protein [Aquimarina mytili]MBL0684834.1 VOC family protein [Aquimarina mytili]